MKKNIKTLKYFLPIILIMSSLASCQDNMKSCISGMKEDGYSHEDAVSACEDAQIESQIR